MNRQNYFKINQMFREYVPSKKLHFNNFKEKNIF